MDERKEFKGTKKKKITNEGNKLAGRKRLEETDNYGPKKKKLRTKIKEENNGPKSNELIDPQKRKNGPKEG